MNSNRENLLDILSIYKFPFISDNVLLQYLIDQYIINGQYLCSKTRLFLPSSISNIDKYDILQHIVRRIPIYFGKTRDDMFNWNSVKNILNYDYHNLQIDSNLVSNIRYAIAGPINIMEYNGQPEIRAWVIHLWGVNFETTESDDYKILYANPGGLNVETYFERQLDILNMIVESAKYARGIERAEHVKIQMPMIGMGQFLKAIPLKAQEACQLLFIEAISKVLSSNSDISLKLCIYTPNDFSNNCLERLGNLSTKYPVFSLGLGQENGNLLLGVENPCIDNGNTLTCVVNAWDTRSFIGNGGSRDNTIDGFIVANAGGYNNQFRNTSFLHNSFFCPNVLNPKKWIITN
jgi:hypothetical protein